MSDEGTEPLSEAERLNALAVLSREVAVTQTSGDLDIGFPIPAPCDDPRPQWRCSYRCECGVLIELHTAEGWRAYFTRYAEACEREERQHRERADGLERAAFNYRAVAERPPTSLRGAS